MPTGKENLLDILLQQTQAYYLSDLRKPELEPKMAQALATIPESTHGLREWNGAVSYLFPSSPVVESALEAKNYLLLQMDTATSAAAAVVK